MKGFKWLLTTMAMALGCITNTYAYKDYEAIRVDGSFYIQVRGVIDELGGSATWDNTKKEATFTLDNNKVTVGIGNSTAYIHGEPYQISNMPVLLNGSTYIPLRFVGEGLGADVGYHDKYKLAFIEYNGKSAVAHVNGEDADIDGFARSIAPRYQLRLKIEGKQGEYVLRNRRNELITPTNYGNEKAGEVLFADDRLNSGQWFLTHRKKVANNDTVEQLTYLYESRYETPLRLENPIDIEYYHTNTLKIPTYTVEFKDEGSWGNYELVGTYEGWAKTLDVKWK